MDDRATRRDFLKTSIAGAAGLALAGTGIRASAQGERRPGLPGLRPEISPRALSARLAVCSWSLQPSSAEDLLAKLAATGLSRTQIALDPIRVNEGSRWSNFTALCKAKGVTCVSGMLGTVGEDYTTLDSIRKTGGVVPDATWPQTWKNVQADAALAAQLGLELVTFHAGFLPHEETDPSFSTLQSRVRQIADLFAGHGMAIGLETGQEEAATMAAFLRTLGRRNVGVNLDPANIILYDKGDPVAAVRTLGPWIRQCHLKDAVRTKTPGTWGEEVRLGTGQVEWKGFFQALNAAQFSGNLCIEREAGKERVADIRAAREYVERLGV
jgi:L-ribulose-5-phosphate 3-epimerase